MRGLMTPDDYNMFYVHASEEKLHGLWDFPDRPEISLRRKDQVMQSENTYIVFLLVRTLGPTIFQIKRNCFTYSVVSFDVVFVQF